MRVQSAVSFIFRCLMDWDFLQGFFFTLNEFIYAIVTGWGSMTNTTLELNHVLWPLLQMIMVENWKLSCHFCSAGRSGNIGQLYSCHWSWQNGMCLLALCVYESIRHGCWVEILVWSATHCSGLHAAAKSHIVQLYCQENCFSMLSYSLVHCITMLASVYWTFRPLY